jgi:hypothetical protein
LKALTRVERVENTWVSLPFGIEPVWSQREDYLNLASISSCSWGGSNLTEIGWSWVVEGRVEARGTFRWPESASAIDNDVAARLIRAEKAMVIGCPARALPAGLFDAITSGAVSSVGLPRGFDEGRLAPLRDTLLRLSASVATQCRMTVDDAASH